MPGRRQSWRGTRSSNSQPRSIPTTAGSCAGRAAEEYDRWRPSYPQRRWTGSRRRHLFASQMSVQEPGNSPSYCSPVGLRSIQWSLMSGCSPGDADRDEDRAALTRVVDRRVGRFSQGRPWVGHGSVVCTHEGPFNGAGRRGATTCAGWRCAGSTAEISCGGWL